jgi:hypothetical protein
MRELAESYLLRKGHVMKPGLLTVSSLFFSVFASAAPPVTSEPYHPPIRSAQVSGVIQYAFDEICRFEVSVPVYDQRKERSFAVPAYVDCIATVEGQPALVRTALTIELKVDKVEAVDVKWLDVSMFAMEKKGKDLGATIGYIHGSVATEDLGEKSLRFFTDARGKIGKRDQYRIVLKMTETQL